VDAVCNEHFRVLSKGYEERDVIVEKKVDAEAERVRMTVDRPRDKEREVCAKRASPSFARAIARPAPESLGLSFPPF
jgi:hypothetical protein